MRKTSIPVPKQTFRVQERPLFLKMLQSHTSCSYLAASGNTEAWRNETAAVLNRDPTARDHKRACAHGARREPSRRRQSTVSPHPPALAAGYGEAILRAPSTHCGLLGLAGLLGSWQPFASEWRLQFRAATASSVQWTLHRPCGSGQPAANSPEDAQLLGVAGPAATERTAER